MTALRRVRHDALTRQDVAELRTLFDAEYGAAHGDWDPDAPYGYAPADVHIIAGDGRALGHVGYQRRTIRVGDRMVTVAGTGGMLVGPQARGSGLGMRLLAELQAAMRASRDIEFGYLGCAPAAAPFYVRAGWVRVHVAERHVSRSDGTHVWEAPGAPILVCAAAREVDEWPSGDVDLQGRPW
ncbi:hypothetical protein SRABI76_00902 [Microbacterium oxydans]|uniref:GNAT family N-acetyltransferase n=1 Tax=Microbacterium oxydans TaxID=82380 RepID=UPI001D98EDD8|nr:GNAT family N-acetyltransferase [Microbacterium oxydans]CAH0155534.1 hypothetical protein SRABI76_00902 [Microbacterium oxydans]